MGGTDPSQSQADPQRSDQVTGAAPDSSIEEATPSRPSSHHLQLNLGVAQASHELAEYFNGLMVGMLEVRIFPLAKYWQRAKA